MPNTRTVTAVVRKWAADPILWIGLACLLFASLFAIPYIAKLDKTYWDGAGKGLSLIRDEAFDEAVTVLSRPSGKRDGWAQYLLHIAHLASGNGEAAIQALKRAKSHGYPHASLLLSERHLFEIVDKIKSMETIEPEAVRQVVVDGTGAIDQILHDSLDEAKEERRPYKYVFAAHGIMMLTSVGYRIEEQQLSTLLRLSAFAEDPGLDHVLALYLTGRLGENDGFIEPYARYQNIASHSTGYPSFLESGARALSPMTMLILGSIARSENICDEYGEVMCEAVSEFWATTGDMAARADLVERLLQRDALNEFGTDAYGWCFSDRGGDPACVVGAFDAHMNCTIRDRLYRRIDITRSRYYDTCRRAFLKGDGEYCAVCLIARETMGEKWRRSLDGE